ncbi:hypothetical protein DFP72DRAFT_971098, partial [Ephemerocybe angulata]
MASKESIRITRSVARKTAACTPRVTIPDDVLREIFEHCTLMSTTSMPNTSPAEAPIVLTHVCGQWRRVAQDCASLWKTLRVRQP